MQMRACPKSISDAWRIGMQSSASRKKVMMRVVRAERHLVFRCSVFYSGSAQSDR